MTSISQTKKIIVNVFPGGFNWPIFVGLSKGFFTDRGIEVEMQNTSGSVHQMTDFIEEKCDIVMTGFDNIVAYYEGHGERPLGLQPDLFAFLGSDNSFLSLVAAKEIATIRDLEKQTIALDAVTTGYSFALFEVLRRSGLPQGSYEVERVGGMLQRIADLRNGGHPATLLSSPYDIIAKSEGFKSLCYVKDILGEYQGNVAATRRPWAAKNPELVIAYTGAYLGALQWLADANNAPEAQEILMAYVKDISPNLAALSYDHMLHPSSGFFRDGRLREDGIETVLSLRRHYGQARDVHFEMSKYTDFNYWNIAHKELTVRR